MIRFFVNHPRLAATPAGQSAVLRAQWRIIKRLTGQLRSLQAAKAAREAWPAHHNLWLCIHGTPALGTEVGHEASTWDNADTGGNGHYGGLQMHPGWGYGTSYYASDDSQLVQEQAAETAYRVSGYSASWLIQQWGQTIGPCWRYA